MEGIYVQQQELHCFTCTNKVTTQKWKSLMLKTKQKVINKFAGRIYLKGKLQRYLTLKWIKTMNVGKLLKIMK